MRPKVSSHHHLLWWSQCMRRTGESRHLLPLTMRQRRSGSIPRKTLGRARRPGAHAVLFAKRPMTSEAAVSFMAPTLRRPLTRGRNVTQTLPSDHLHRARKDGRPSEKAHLRGVRGLPRTRHSLPTRVARTAKPQWKARPGLGAAAGRDVRCRVAWGWDALYL